MSRLTRRNALTAVAALPALAVPAAIAAMAAPDAEVFAAGRAVEAAWRGLGEACDVLGVADEAMFEWQRRNPKPVMRKYQKASEIERDNWIRLVAEADDPIKVVAIILSPGADEEAAHQEHEEAMKAWQLRYEAAEHENERIAAEALQTAAGDELSEAVERLANTRATTIDGLRCKARLFRMMDEDNKDLMASLLNDLTE